MGTEYVPTGVQQGAGTDGIRAIEAGFVAPVIKALGVLVTKYSVPTGAKDPRQLDLFPEIRHPGL